MVGKFPDCITQSRGHDVNAKIVWNMLIRTEGSHINATHVARSQCMHTTRVNYTCAISSGEFAGIITHLNFKQQPASFFSFFFHFSAI